MATFIVAIAYRRNVVLCEQYVENFTVAYFASFIWAHFAHEVFTLSKN